MTSTSVTPIDNLAAPAQDGGVLVWPDATELPRLVEQNRAHLAECNALILDRPLCEWRDVSCGPDPVILAGHQPDFIHTGVWVKHVAATELARRLGGHARYLLVDSDVPGHFGLAWPKQEQGTLARAWSAPPIRSSGVAYEYFEEAPDVSWRRFFQEIADGPGTALPAFASAFVDSNPSTAASGTDYVSRWQRGMAALDAAAGVTSPKYVRVSRVCDRVDVDGLVVAAFISHLLHAALPFAQVYNEALARYRARRGIRGRQHPIPDLQVSVDRIELPFWLVRRQGPRSRLFVSHTSAGGLSIYGGDDQIVSVAMNELIRTPKSLFELLPPGVAIRPRALALTLFARLLAGDLFIHGIGGAKYDQITDDIIRSFWRIDPPAYACVSATLMLPLASHAVSAADLAAARYRVRDVRYNPHRYLENRASDAMARLLNDRSDAIHDAKSLESNSPRDRETRRRAFDRIHAANDAVLSEAPTLIPILRDRLVFLEKCMEHNQVAASREWFLALHPLARLRSLATRICESIG